MQRSEEHLTVAALQRAQAAVRVRRGRIDRAHRQQFAQRIADGAAVQLGAARAGDGHKLVPVANHDRHAEVFGQNLGIDGGELAQAQQRRILFKNDFPVGIGKNFQRVALAYALGAADLLGDDHAAQLVDAAHDARCFHCPQHPFLIVGSGGNWK